MLSFIEPSLAELLRASLRGLIADASRVECFGKRDARQLRDA